MEAKEILLLVMSLRNVGARGCFTAAVTLWWAHGGHLRIAARLERRTRRFPRPPLPLRSGTEHREPRTTTERP